MRHTAGNRLFFYHRDYEIISAALETSVVWKTCMCTSYTPITSDNKQVDGVNADPNPNLFQLPPFFWVHLCIYTVLVPCSLLVCLFPHVSPVIPRLLFPGARLFPICLICSTFLFNNSVFLDSSCCLCVAWFFFDFGLWLLALNVAFSGACAEVSFVLTDVLFHNRQGDWRKSVFKMRELF